MPAEGENITLNDTAEARFKKFGIGGNSWQETREGYNLLNLTDISNEAVASLSNNEITLTWESGFDCFLVNGENQNISLDANNTYTVSFEHKGNKINFGNYQDTTNKVTTGNTSSYTRYSFSFTSLETLRLDITRNDLTGSCNIKNIMIYKGTDIKDYEQYGAMPSPNYKSDIQNVTGNANITICNKNLVNVQDFIEALSTLYQGEELYNNKNCIKLGRVQTADTSYKYMLNGLKENTQYTIQLNTILVGNNSDIAFVYSDGSSKTITSGKTSTDFIKITATSEKNKTLTGLRVSCFSWSQYWYIEKDSIQLEEGTVATEYQAHQSQQFTFPLAEGQRLMKGDYLADDGIHHKSGRYVFTGDEVNVVKKWEEDADDIFFFPGLVQYQEDTLNLQLVGCKCNKYECTHYDGGKGSIWGEKSTNRDLFAITYKNSLTNTRNSGVLIKDNRFSTIEELLDNLKEQYNNGTPVYFEYILAEEEIESYTEEQQTVHDEIKKTAHSYGEQTHIFSTDEISLIFDVEARKDMNTVISNLESMILANASEEV